MTQADDPEPDPGSPVSDPDSATDIERTLAHKLAVATQVEGLIKPQLDSFGRTQGLIATSIIGLFVLMVVVLTLAYLLAPLTPAADRITAGADKARELANTLLLPIVTLVLGYYFGKRAD